MSGITAAGVLGVLSKGRLDQFARDLGVTLPDGAQQAAQVSGILATKPPLDAVLARLTRDELRAACRAHSLDHKARSRAELMERLGVAPKPARPEEDRQLHHSMGLPYAGDMAVVRHRQYLVASVLAALELGHQTLVKLLCLDDDAAGRELEVLWEGTGDLAVLGLARGWHPMSSAASRRHLVSAVRADMVGPFVPCR